MMSNMTLARPYAKAIFEHAKLHHALDVWCDILRVFAVAACDKNTQKFIANPLSSQNQRLELFLSVLNIKKIDEMTQRSLKNILALLAHHKRLLLLPIISSMYCQLLAEHNKTLQVEIISFSQISANQCEKFKAALNKKLHREVTLNISIDESLLGGAVIYAGNVVIDGSLRGRLNKLQNAMVA